MAEYSSKSFAAPFASNGLTKEKVIDSYNDDMKLETFACVPERNLSYGWTVSECSIFALCRGWIRRKYAKTN